MSLPTREETREARKLGERWGGDDVTDQIVMAYVDGRLTPRPDCPFCHGSGIDQTPIVDGPCAVCGGHGYDPDTIERMAVAYLVHEYGGTNVEEDMEWADEAKEPGGFAWKVAISQLDALYGKDIQ